MTLPKCICSINFRDIVNKTYQDFDKKFIDERTGKVYNFFGVVYAADDFYYGMYNKENGLRLLSCVGSLKTHGYSLYEESNNE